MTMLDIDRLRAWIEPSGDGFLAAFAAVRAGSNIPIPRPPATRHFASYSEAKLWLESEGRAFGLPIEWVDSPNDSRPSTGAHMRVLARYLAPAAR